MSNNRPVKGPGRGGAAFRTGQMVENPGKMLGRLLAYVYKNYKIHIILAVSYTHLTLPTIPFV